MKGDPFQGFPDTSSLARWLVDAAVGSGGITLLRVPTYDGQSSFFRKPTVGYVVGGKVPSLALDWVATSFDGCVRLVEKWLVRQPHTVNAVGSWYDKNDNTLVFDIVDIYDDMDQARAVGMDRKEKAIYDLAGGQDIFLELLREDDPVQVIDDADLQHVDNDDFPMSVEYDGLWGSSDFDNDQAAAREDEFEREWLD